MDLFIKLFLILLFDSFSVVFIICKVFYITGAAALMHKSGMKWYYALIPFYSDYQLARCANREYEGRVFFLLNLSYSIFSMISVIFNTLDDIYIELTPLTYLGATIILVFLLAILIYNIRIFNGFTEVYGVSKLWLVLCISEFTCVIPMLIWGFSKKYQPKWKVEDLKVEMSKIVRNGTSSDMTDGLSVDITSRSVSDFFKKKYLLRDIHLEIPTGHMVLLLGGSGAGKTTFVNAVNGYEKADAVIKLNNNDMYKDYNKMKYNVGFVPQPQMMRDKDTVKQTLYDAAELRLPQDLNRKDKIERVNEVMDIFGLIPVQDSLVQKLSGGQKKRLSISMELLSNPALFILDEPDSGLDGVMARELFARLREVANNNKIVIVITHSPDRVIDFFDDVIVLAKDKARTGRLAFYGSVDKAREFFGKESMEEIVKSVNQIEEGGEGLAEEYISKYSKVVLNE